MKIVTNGTARCCGHNKRMRNVAIEKGYKLSEYGLFREGVAKPETVHSEEDIFKLLGLPYKTPEERNI